MRLNLQESTFTGSISPSLIPHLLPGRSEAPETFHITSLPPSIPTDQEAPQDVGDGTCVCVWGGEGFNRLHVGVFVVR